MRGERLNVTIFDGVDALARSLAHEILSGIAAAAAGRRPFVLGCPGGRSPKPVYDEIGRQLASGPADLSHVHLVMMDDYVRETVNGYAHVDGAAHFSCRRFAREAIVAVINHGLPAEARLAPGRVWFPDPADPVSYERHIEALGGIDVFLLASGASDGHVAFNPPGSARESRTRIVALADSTRRDNMATFPAFTSLDEVPRFGVTVGIDTIARHSRTAVMILCGGGKRQAFDRITSACGYDADWPATIVNDCRGGRIVADAAAAGRSVESR